MKESGFATAEQIERITQLQKLTGANLYKLAEGLGFKLKALDFLTYNQAELLIELLEKVWDEKRRKEEPQVVVVKKAPLWLKVVGYVWVYFLRPVLLISWELIKNFDVVVIPLTALWMILPFILIGIGIFLQIISPDFLAPYFIKTNLNTSHTKNLFDIWPLNPYSKVLFFLCLLGLPRYAYRLAKQEEEEWERKFLKNPIKAAYEKGYKKGKNDGFWDGYIIGKM